VGAPLPLFSKLAAMLRAEPDPGARMRSYLLLAEGCCAALVVWTARRLRRGAPDARFFRALFATSLVAAIGAAAWKTGAPFQNSRQLFYPPFDFYFGWMDLEGRSGASGTRLAYAGTNIPYYLFGTGLRNEVFYVNVDRHRDWLMHDYHRAARARRDPLWPNSRPGWDRAAPNYQDWLANLRARGIHLLVVTRADPGEGPHNIADTQKFPIERTWADSHPEDFEPLYGARQNDPFFRIYGVRGSS
jgi:hypothetical protein